MYICQGFFWKKIWGLRNGAWTGVRRPAGSEGFNLGHVRARPVTEALILGAFQEALEVLEVNLPQHVFVLLRSACLVDVNPYAES